MVALQVIFLQPSINGSLAHPSKPRGPPPRFEGETLPRRQPHVRLPPSWDQLTALVYLFLLLAPSTVHPPQHTTLLYPASVLIRVRATAVSAPCSQAHGLQDAQGLRWMREQRRYSSPDINHLIGPGPASVWGLLCTSSLPKVPNTSPRCLSPSLSRLDLSHFSSLLFTHTAHATLSPSRLPVLLSRPRPVRRTPCTQAHLH